jgi:uncharacterized membrane protein
MSETAVTVSRTILAPLETVWGIATDLRSMPETMSVITEVDVLEGGDPFDVGTRWRETRLMMRREVVEEMEVTAVAPQRGYTVEANNHGAHYKTILAFVPVGSGQTEVTMTFEGTPQRPQDVIQRMLGALGLRVVRRALERDLADLADAAEGEGAVVNPT